MPIPVAGLVGNSYYSLIGSFFDECLHTTSSFTSSVKRRRFPLLESSLGLRYATAPGANFQFFQKEDLKGVNDAIAW